MKRGILVGLLVSVLVGNAFAAVTEIVGGVRDGAALGIQLESSVAKNLTIRGGIEFDSGKQPFIGFLGLKFPLTSIGRMPLALGLGAVGYFGNNKTEAGVSLSFIFNRFLDINPLFLELGVDAAGTGKLLAQLGYKIY
ncbi:MAG: hypothetical protein ABIH50_08350 [bacterium]